MLAALSLSILIAFSEKESSVSFLTIDVRGVVIVEMLTHTIYVRLGGVLIEEKMGEEIRFIARRVSSSHVKWGENFLFRPSTDQIILRKKSMLS